MDHALILNGVVNAVWRGHEPDYAGPGQIVPVQPGLAVAGMLWQAGTLSTVSHAIQAYQVKAECQRRILNAYSAMKQLSLLAEGGPAATAMTTQINALRSISKALCTITPIPIDYQNDRYWEVNATRAVPVAVPAPVVAQPTYHPPQIIVMPSQAPLAAPVVVHSYGQAAPLTGVLSEPSHVNAGLPSTLTPTTVPTGHTVLGAQSAAELKPQDMADALRSTAKEITDTLWPAASEVEAEAAVRAMQDHDASRELLIPGAHAANQTIEDYSKNLMLRRADAHIKIMALDQALTQALAALATAHPDERALIGTTFAATAHEIINRV